MDGSANLTIDIAGTKISVSDEANLVFGRQEFAYKLDSRVYVLDQAPVFGVRVRLSGDGIGEATLGKVKVIEASDESEKVVVGPQDFIGTEIALENLPVRAFQFYRVVVGVSGYDEATETFKVEKYDMELSVGLKKTPETANQVGLIVGLSVGAVALVALVVVLVFFLMKRKKVNKKPEERTDQASSTWV